MYASVLFAALICGCGDSQDASSNISDVKRPSLPPTVSIGSPAPVQSDANSDSDSLSVETLLKEITFTRMKAFPETDDVDELRKYRHEKNSKIIDLATQVIAKTHSDPDSKRQFSVAVTYLMSATKELALQGDRVHIDALYEHSSALYKRDPKSKAAADSAYFVATFAYDNAQRFGAQEPKWIEEFARQARLFATNFPGDDRRSVALLNSAAISSELYSMPEEAERCYSLITSQFPKNPVAAQGRAALRRLKLKGTELKLAGPTLDGEFVSMDQFRGRVTLIIYWSTAARAFREELPDLLQLLDKYRRQNIAVLAVNLDEEQTSVDSFLKEFPLAWPQIFHLDAEKRGWNNPAAEYYGVRTLPMYWLVSPDGVVVEMSHSTQNLAAQIDLLYKLGSSQRQRDLQSN